MKATREQAWDLAKASGLTGYELSVGEFERLVHLAQQFTLDQLRADGAVCQYPNSRQLPAVMESLYRIPETLE